MRGNLPAAPTGGVTVLWGEGNIPEEVRASTYPSRRWLFHSPLRIRTLHTTRYNGRGAVDGVGVPVRDASPD